MKKPSSAYRCISHGCEELMIRTPKAWCNTVGGELVCRGCGGPLEKVRLTTEQKAAVEKYEQALAQEDRYLGSVFVTRHGQQEVENRTAHAHQLARRLGVGRWC